MRIGDRTIDRTHPPYVIAEIGVNHNGCADRTLDLVDQAAAAGADAVKLQMFRAELLMSRGSRLAAYQHDAGESDPQAMLERLELSGAELGRVIDAAHQRGLHAIVTVFSLELVEDARAMAWDAFKVASPDVINKPLIDALAEDGRPLIVSTGAATRKEVGRTVRWLGSHLDRSVFLQCVSAYPTPDDLASTEVIADLMALTGGPAGYSDHTRSVRTGARAVRDGAVLLEKHLTYSRDAPGPDHAASLEPSMMRHYIELARAESTGARRPGTDVPAPPRKSVLSIERDVRDVSRQSLVARRPLRAGDRLVRDDLTIKRPGTGVPPWQLERVLGATLSADVGEGELLSECLLSAPAASAV